MKRKFFAFAAVLLLLTTLLWYTLPGVFVKPLLSLNRSLSGLSAKTIQAAGHKIHYLEGGKGETLVLLHGIFAEKDHWVDFARALSDKYHIIVPDLPAFGESDRKDGQVYDYAHQTERLQQLLDALKIDRAHLAGSSMGGTIAALFAIKTPARVQSVAFIGAPHGIRTPQPSEMDNRISAGEAPLVARTAAEFEQMMSLLFAQKPFLPYPVLHAAKHAALQNAASNLRIWNEQLRDRYLLDQEIAKLKLPTFILWGEKDRIFNVSGATALKAKIPQATLKTMPALGHLPMMEAPPESATAYAAFLAELPR